MFVDPTHATRAAVIAIVYGSSEAWVAEIEKKTQRVGLVRGIYFFFRVSFGHGLSALGRAFFSGN